MSRPRRLSEYDYSQGGCYFVTFCTQGRRELLCEIVGRDDLGALRIELYPAGRCVESYIKSIPPAYPGVTVSKYVIMPNHVHLLLVIEGADGGAPRSSRPTQRLFRIVAALKRFTNRYMGMVLWQTSFYDRVVRNEAEYLRIWEYIDTNPAKWREDRFFVSEEACEQ